MAEPFKKMLWLINQFKIFGRIVYPKSILLTDVCPPFVVKMKKGVCVCVRERERGVFTGVRQLVVDP